MTYFYNEFFLTLCCWKMVKLDIKFHGSSSYKMSARISRPVKIFMHFPWISGCRFIWLTKWHKLAFERFRSSKRFRIKYVLYALLIKAYKLEQKLWRGQVFIRENIELCGHSQKLDVMILKKKKFKLFATSIRFLIVDWCHLRSVRNSTTE